jgi:hypothetical protein
MPRKTFLQWLADEHPEVTLTKWQANWCVVLEGTRTMIMQSPVASGRTFFLKLYAEYLKYAA